MAQAMKATTVAMKSQMGEFDIGAIEDMVRTVCIKTESMQVFIIKLIVHLFYRLYVHSPLMSSARRHGRPHARH